MTDATQVNPAIPSTDPAQNLVPTPTPAVPATPGAANDPAAAASTDQSPLDLLDQILKDAQAKASEASAEKIADDEKKREEERERQRQLDQQKVEEELAQIEQMKTSPEYQAMQQQKQDAVVQKEEHQKQMTGMEILQLEHSKL